MAILFKEAGLCGLALMLAYTNVAHGQEHPALNKATSTKEARTSYFSGYKAQQEVKVGNWREANDEVGRIGGWRVYTREAADALEADKKAEEAAKAARLPQAPVAPAPTPTQGDHRHGHRH